MNLASLKHLLAAGILAGALIGTAAVAAPVVYDGTINSGDTVTGHIDEPDGGANNDFWKFTANAGDYVVITGHRLDAALDLAFTLYFGTDDATWVGMGGGDDNIPELPGYEGPFSDPQFVGVLPSTGDYSIMMWAFLSNTLTEEGDNYQLQLTIRPGTPVPAPAALGIVGLGLMGLGLARRRK